MPSFSLERRSFLKGLLAAGAGLQGHALGQPQSPSGNRSPRQPNILFLLTDDQHPQAIGSAGNQIIVTPEMDRLAAEGIYFRNNFVTTAICNASRASIFTGLYMGAHQIINFTQGLTPALKSMSYPWVLRQGGYYTGFIGKYGVGFDLPEEEFDFWDGFAGQNVFFHKTGGKWKHLTEMIGDSALRFIDTCPRHQPFCLSISFKAPHVIDHLPNPFQPDPKYASLYEDVDIPPPGSRDRKYFDRLPDFLQRSINHMRYWRYDSQERYQQHVKDYYRTLTGVDEVIGRIRSRLAERGLADNTVIIFTSDNGYFLGEHQFDGKWLMYEESIRTPMIVYDPRSAPATKGTTIDAMSLNIDCSPTIIDLAGMPIPEAVQGRSLVPFLQGRKPSDWRTEWFYEHLFDYPTIPQCEGVRTGKWKYINYLGRDPDYEELFNLENDPREIHNLAGTTDSRKVLHEMRQRYLRLRKNVVTDKLPHPDFPGRPVPDLL